MSGCPNCERVEADLARRAAANRQLQDRLEGKANHIRRLRRERDEARSHLRRVLLEMGVGVSRPTSSWLAADAVDRDPGEESPNPPWDRWASVPEALSVNTFWHVSDSDPALGPRSQPVAAHSSLIAQGQGEPGADEH